MSLSLNNKNILLGVSGGIAAYKSAELLRRLQDQGAEVRVIMTAGACEFITPLTFQALSGHPVHTDLLDPQAEAAMGHIELARWADAIIIAPATANTLSRLAQGRSDELLSAVCLASRAPLALAPAMNHVMWSSRATQANLEVLRQRGVQVFGPEHGEQACGETGEGRLLDIPSLVKHIGQLFTQGLLQGQRVMITAGPTHEPIDPVRFIGNRSSGRMGFAIAEAALEQGASVTLVAGPVHLATPSHAKRIDVQTALEMHQAVMRDIHQQDIFIATAAVADYRPSDVEAQKIKKSQDSQQDSLQLSLTLNPDILREVAALQDAPFTLGFAAETQHVKDYALDKLKRKQLDMIAANQVSQVVDSEGAIQDSGFNSDYNALQVFWPGGGQQLPHDRKSVLARQLISLLAQRYAQGRT